MIKTDQYIEKYHVLHPRIIGSFYFRQFRHSKLYELKRYEASFGAYRDDFLFCDPVFVYFSGA